MQKHNSIIILVLLLPVFASILTPLKKKYRKLFLFFLGSIPLVNIGLLYNAGITNQPIVLSGMFIFSLDSYSYLFAMLVNACWVITILYSSAYVRYHFQAKAEAFHKYLSICVALILATGTSGNIFTLICFYTVSIPMIYPLVIMRENSESFRAGKVYLLSTLLPVFFIIIPVFLYLGCLFEPFQELSIKNLGLSDRQAALVLAVLIIGFSKNCVAPFHLWLSKTSVAPAPVSALVHSVGAVQTGTIAIIKIGTYLYGLDYLSTLNDDFFETGWITWLCGFTAIYTAYRAYKTTDLKERFSFSTVGQLSYIITAILVGTKGSVLGAILHIVSHAIAKINLFFIAGVFSSLYGTVKTYDVSKIVPNVRWTAVATAISGLSITGFPLLAGYYSKDLMLLEEIHRHHYAAAVFLLIGSVVNFFYIFPVLKAGVVGKKDPQFVAHHVPVAMRLSILICCILTLSFSKYIFVVTHFLGFVH